MAFPGVEHVKFGAVHRGAYDAATSIEALTGARTADGDLIFEPGPTRSAR